MIHYAADEPESGRSAYNLPSLPPSMDPCSILTAPLSRYIRFYPMKEAAHLHSRRRDTRRSPDFGVGLAPLRSPRISYRQVGKLLASCARVLVPAPSMYRPAD